MWSVDYEGEAFERFLWSLPTYEQAVLVAAIEHVLQVHGIDICAGEWGTPLGDGLYEFRVRKSLGTILKSAGLPTPPGSEAGHTTLLRVFCTFHGDRIVLLLHGYDKKVDPSERRQRREIARARKLLMQWKQQHLR